ncbi:hypothetical protein BDR04DRAFT_1165576, partial [Suillus decipiens]
MDFLFIQWFGHDANFRSSWSAKHLPRIRFLTGEDPSAFGFLDPDVIIRGVHLVPAFELGKTKELLADSFVRHDADLDQDWLYFYVNIFVDRDIFMRYRGGGVGHKISREWDKFLQSDGAQVMDEEDEEQEEEDGEEGEGESEGEDEIEDEDDEGQDEDEDEGEEDPDRIEADEGEELDDEFLAAEGYGA